jgi:hypothetical protein
MIDGPLGGAAFNNEFGRPNLGGYFRVFEQDVAGVQRGYHKPIMIAGGLGAISAGRRTSCPSAPARCWCSWAARACASAWAAARPVRWPPGTNTAALDFDSVQRGNPEIQRRAQEVINHCWALGERQPHPGHPRRGRRRHQQRLSRAGGRRRARAPPSTCARCRWRRAAWRRRRSGATRARSATCWRSTRPAAAVRADVRARALPLRRGRRGHRRAPAGARRTAPAASA